MERKRDQARGNPALLLLSWPLETVCNLMQLTLPKRHRQARP